MAYAIGAERRHNVFRGYTSFISYLIESFFPAVIRIFNAIRTFI